MAGRAGAVFGAAFGMMAGGAGAGFLVAAREEPAKLSDTAVAMGLLTRPAWTIPAIAIAQDTPHNRAMALGEPSFTAESRAASPPPPFPRDPLPYTIPMSYGLLYVKTPIKT